MAVHPPPSGPFEVSRFEASLVRILRFFLHQMPAEQVRRLLDEKLHRPKCLSANALRLIKDSLAKGCVLYLVRAGGWKQERFLRGDQPVSGRLWERSGGEELALNFSHHSLDFLIWMTASRLKESKPLWFPSQPTELTPADHLLLYLAFQELRQENEWLRALRVPGSVFARNPLCWLMYPDDLAELGPEAVPDFRDWMQGNAACLLEALQPRLATRWLQIEQGKGQVADWQRMRVYGLAQSRVLDRYTHAAEAASRPDLTRFLLDVGSRLLGSAGMNVTFWTGGLQGNAPPRLADRLQTQQHALALLHQFQRLQQWERRARTVGFFDEGYPAAQMWLAEWEHHDGDTIHARAAMVLQQVQPLRLNPGASAGTDPPTEPTPPDGSTPTN